MAACLFTWQGSAMRQMMQCHLRISGHSLGGEDLPVLLSIGAMFLDKMTFSHLCYNLQRCGLYTSPGKVNLNLHLHTYCNYYCWLAVLHVTWSNIQEWTFSSCVHQQLLHTKITTWFFLELHIEFVMIHGQPYNEVRIIDKKALIRHFIMLLFYPVCFYNEGEEWILIASLDLCISASLQKHWRQKYFFDMQLSMAVWGLPSLASTHQYSHPYFLLWQSLLCTVIFMITHFDRRFRSLPGTPVTKCKSVLLLS